MPERSGHSDRDEIRRRLDELLHIAEQRAQANQDPAFPIESDELVHGIEELVDLLGKPEPSTRETKRAEERDLADTSVSRGDSSASRGLSAANLTLLRGHVINLNQGQFSSDDQYSTKPEDVDRIFQQDIPGWMKGLEGKPAHIVFYAHGGLTDEATGLDMALQQVPWWVANGVYPIYFVWQTGFWQTVGHLLQGVQQRSVAAGARDFFDYTTDPALEQLARLLGGPLIWGGMKRSAELASSPGGNGVPEGGANYTARRLAEFLKGLGGTTPVNVHAVGHSAGSIFHAYFIPASLKAGVSQFKTLQFLAPAIRVDTFKQTLQNIVQQSAGVGKLVMYSMKEPFEKADNCASLYHKSLLYLIYYALEDQRKTPILGLEECVWRDPELKTLFGLDGSKRKAEAIWSETSISSGLNASRCLSHGGFDDDAATMGAALRHVLAIEDDKIPIKESTVFSQGGRSMEMKQAPVAAKIISTVMANGDARVTPNFQPGAPNLALTGGGQRRAICVGINAYPGANQLYGCVPDAQLWARTLGSLGFQTQTILDGNATYETLVNSLKSLLASSKEGDVIVFQYSGHGTSIPHSNGQEPDEALVPFDFFSTGALLIDKQLASVFNDLPQGVNLTCFFDCCHSGDITRLLLTGNTRSRFIKLNPLQIAQYNQFALKRELHLLPPKRSRGIQRDITFAACGRAELAIETNGQGEFTQKATDLIRKSSGSISNAQFKASVVAAFGSGAQQHPELNGAISNFDRPFLQPLNGSAAPQKVSEATADTQSSMPSGSTAQLIARTLRAVADQIETGR